MTVLKCAKSLLKKFLSSRQTEVLDNGINTASVATPKTMIDCMIDGIKELKEARPDNNTLLVGVLYGLFIADALHKLTEKERAELITD